MNCKENNRTNEGNRGSFASFASLAVGCLVFVLFSFGTVPYTRFVAEAAGGLCEQAYQACLGAMKDHYLYKLRCEQEWEKCVERKCREQAMPSGSMCKSDIDCATSCTEKASSKTGLIACCFGGPKRNNKCPKEIDGKCVDSNASPQFLTGPSYTENSVLPNETADVANQIARPGPYENLDSQIFLADPLSRCEGQCASGDDKIGITPAELYDRLDVFNSEGASPKGSIDQVKFVPAESTDPKSITIPDFTSLTNGASSNLSAPARPIDVRQNTSFLPISAQTFQPTYQVTHVPSSIAWYSRLWNMISGIFR